jgi:putative glycosyltransferase
MKLSVVTTIYRTAQCIEEFHARAAAAAHEMGAVLELVLVNDGSPDDGLEVALGLARRDSRVLVIDLSRNFGQHKAIWTGILHATGDLIAVLDGDLEEDPGWLVAFERTRRETGADVIYGITDTIRGTPIYRLGRAAFYRSMTFFAGQAFPRNITTARLMTRRYVEALRSFPEREILMIGLWAIAGFVQIPHRVAKAPKSRTRYTLFQLSAMFVHGVTSFSILPLALVFVAGLVMSVVAVAFIAYLVYLKFVARVGVEGWTSVIALQLLIGGLLLSFNGVLAIYIGTIFLEVKQRPRTIIRAVTQFPQAPSCQDDQDDTLQRLGRRIR